MKLLNAGKNNQILVKTMCTNQLKKPLHIAPTVHQLHDLLCCICASDVFILIDIVA